jgi:alkylation response protein AidB-like acyl-CoA dehydrogenase
VITFEPVELDASERALRDDVRAFLEAELPRGSFHPSLGMNATKDPAFSRKLGTRGWLGMALPERYGGHNRSAVDRFVVVAELLRWGAPVGHHWVADRQSGPVIAKFGTEEQKQRFLPGICSGELSFCIGMSEPDSGSDLASLSTRAIRASGRDGDGWLLDGRKIWTTAADVNDWIIVLCRTTPRNDVDDKRQGMSQLLVDLKSPGITAKPIPFIDGTADFCEVVFDNVFVPDNLVLGEVGQGWSQNTSELAYERGGPDRWLSSFLLVEELIRRSDPESCSDTVADLLGSVVADYWVLHQLSLSVARAIDRGEAPAIESSLVKELGTRFEQDVVTAVLAVVDEAPNLAATSTFEMLLATAALTAPSFTVRGGTNEVLRSVAAKGLRPSGLSTTAAASTMHGADPLVAETVTRLLAGICTHEEVERAEGDGWSAAAWSALADAGFPWVGINESAGGSGGTLFDLAAILRAVGANAAAVPVAETAMVGGWWLATCGLALPSGPVTVLDQAGAAEVVNGRLLLDGVAPWARHAEQIVVSVPVDGSIAVVAVPRSVVTITAGANLAGEARDRVVADLALADLDHVRLDDNAETAAQLDLLWQRGALSRVVMAAGALSTMAQITIDYTNERRQFGKPVATFQAVQHHLVTVAQSAVRVQMAADIAVRAMATGTLGIEVAAARIVTADAITIGTRAAHQAHGAMGVTREYPLHQYTRRLWAWRHEYGTTTDWRSSLGRHVHATGADALFPLITG